MLAADAESVERGGKRAKRRLKRCGRAAQPRLQHCGRLMMWKLLRLVDKT